eukprot:1674817-Rhodomonas_salina.1
MSGTDDVRSGMSVADWLDYALAQLCPVLMEGVLVPGAARGPGAAGEREGAAAAGGAGPSQRSRRDV